MNHASSPEIQPDETGFRSRARLAAKLALAAPFITFLLRLFILSFEKDSSSGHWNATYFVQTGLLILVVLSGFCAAIYALRSIRSHGRLGLLWQGLTGLILNTLLILAFGLEIFSSFLIKGEQQQQAIRQFKRSSDETIADIRKKAPNVTRQDADEFAQRTLAINNRAIQDSTGAQKNVFEATAAYLTRLQKEGRPYMQAVDSLLAAEILLPDSNINREKIAQNRQLAQALVTTALSFSNFVHNSGSIYRAELKTRGLSPKDLEMAAQGFDERGSNRLLQAQIFGADVRIGTASLAILDLFDEQFGQWKKDPKTGLVLFSDPTAAKKYKDSLAAIDAASESRAEFQRQVLPKAK